MRYRTVKSRKYGTLYKPVLNGKDVSAVICYTEKEAVRISKAIEHYSNIKG